MIQKATREEIPNESKNGLKNVNGSIAMARTNKPHSATAQFFINVKDNEFLDYPGQDGWGYCVFGQVVEGMEVVNAIKNVATTRRAGHQDVPVTAVIIEQASII
jgi:peptidyl-prolyl cis-trans isomerase B (cyclophilin B)